MTQIELADAIGMSQEWVTKVETGRIATPRPATLRKLADALRLNLADLIIASDQAKSRADAERLATSVVGLVASQSSSHSYRPARPSLADGGG